MTKIIDLPKKKENNKLYQHTIQNEINCNGVGLHSGKDITLKFSPAKTDTGIVFVRIDLEEGNNTIKATWDNVVDTRMCTVISNGKGAIVGTIEHLMSAIIGCGIDNMIIEINGPEVPIMDGSSDPFLFLFDCAGLVEQDKPRKAIKVLKYVQVKENEKVVSITPSEHTSFSFSIDFDADVIGKQDREVKLDKSVFKNEISKARTFGFLKDYEMLKEMGLALGGSLENAVVVDKEGKLMNEDGLRYKDEFVRHKILDAIGDLFLAGAPIIGSFKGIKSGHDLNNKILHAIFSDKKAWKMVDMTAQDEFESEFTLQIAV